MSHKDLKLSGRERVDIFVIFIFFQFLFIFLFLFPLLCVKHVLNSVVRRTVKINCVGTIRLYVKLSFLVSRPNTIGGGGEAKINRPEPPCKTLARCNKFIPNRT